MAAKHRILSVTTPLGPETFLLTAFSGREEISRGFHYELELLSEREPAAVRELIGQPIAWRVHHPGAEPRWFHGVVSRLSAGRLDVRDLRTYRAVVVPQLAYRGQGVGCRIHEEQSVPDVVKAVLDRIGVKDCTAVLRARHAPRPLCVQYRESDWHYLCRLLEDEAVFFFFTHEEGRHTLVLADDAASCPHLAGQEVASWERTYEGPAHDDGPPTEVIKGSSRSVTFSAGSKFTPSGPDDEGGEYLLIAVEHTTREGGREYGNTFTAVPTSARFRPARVTPRPVVPGPRLGIVVAPKGEESRGGEAVRVRLLGDDAPCWVRLVGDGAIPPRVGQEVRVDFLEGDPEKPLIAGGGGARPESTKGVEAPTPFMDSGRATPTQDGRNVRLKTGDDMLTLEAGNQMTRLDLGRCLTEAVGGIELRAGPSRITIDPTAIVIEGLVVQVHGHVQAEVKGLMTRIDADGVVQVQGGATMVG